MTTSVLILLVLFEVCHWLADYTWLSTPWMLNAKKFGKPLTPILAHAWVHAMLMGIVMLFFPIFPITMFALFGIQLIAHFLIDVGKGRLTKAIKVFQDPTNKWFWVLMGFDQLLHQLVIIFMVYNAF